MKAIPEIELLKLALEALRRPVPNAALALEVLDDWLTRHDASDARPAATASTSRGVSFGDAAAQLGYSTKTIRGMAKRGEIPVIGSGRTQRVLLDEAIEALRARTNRTTERVGDALEQEGADYVRARGRRGA